VVRVLDTRGEKEKDGMRRRIKSARSVRAHSPTGVDRGSLSVSQNFVSSSYSAPNLFLTVAGMLSEGKVTAMLHSSSIMAGEPTLRFFI
jgi:hypothetical protein